MFIFLNIMFVLLKNSYSYQKIPPYHINNNYINSVPNQFKSHCTKSVKINADKIQIKMNTHI